LESSYEDRLRGRFGASIVEKDVHQHVQNVLTEVAPRAADPLVLALDVETQRVAQAALDAIHDDPNVGCTGAAVMIDVRTGEILAMASSPGYDANVWAQSTLEQRAWLRNALSAEHADEHDRPLINRAMLSAVAPGSVFKILT